jgi:hypothetical protein
MLVLRCIKQKENSKMDKFLKLLIDVLDIEENALIPDHKYLQFNDDLVDFSLIISPSDNKKEEDEKSFFVLTSLTEKELKFHFLKDNLKAEVFWNKDILMDYLKRINSEKLFIEFLDLKNQTLIGKCELKRNTKNNSYFFIENFLI